MLDTFRHNRPLYRSNIRRDSTCTTTMTTATYNTFGSLTQRSYLPTYKQAISIYKAIQSSHTNMLTDGCIRTLASFVVQAWENDPGSTVAEISSLMQSVVNTTSLDTRKISLDDALAHAYTNNENMAIVVCPEFALLVAVHYIHQLKMKYQNIVGAHGCSRRLVMVAFLVAAKYIQASLRLMVEPSFKSTSSPATTMEPFPQAHIKLSTERSTLQQSLSSATSAKHRKMSDIQSFKQLFAEVMKEDVPESTIERMELEFLHFLNYDLSLTDPMSLVNWAQEYSSQTQYTSGDEAGDEMDDDDDDDDDDE